MRAQIALFTALVLLNATVQPLLAIPLPLARRIRKDLEKIRAGHFIEVLFDGEKKDSGRFVEVSKNRIVIKIEEPGKVRTQYFYLREVTAIRRAMPAGNDLYLDPSDLGGLACGQRARFTTRDQAQIEGWVVRAGDDEVQLEVLKSEPEGRAKGSVAVIPTRDISTVHMIMDRVNTVGAGIVAGSVFGLAPGIVAGIIIKNTVPKKTVTIHVLPK